MLTLQMQHMYILVAVYAPSFSPFPLPPSPLPLLSLLLPSLPLLSPPSFSPSPLPPLTLFPSQPVKSQQVVAEKEEEEEFFGSWTATFSPSMFISSHSCSLPSHYSHTLSQSICVFVTLRLSFPPSSFSFFLLPTPSSHPLFFPLDTGVDRELQRLLANEKANFKLLAEKVRMDLIL